MSSDDFAATTERRFEAVERQLNQLRIDIGPLKAAHVRSAARSVADAVRLNKGINVHSRGNRSLASRGPGTEPDLMQDQLNKFVRVTFSLSRS